MGKPLNHIDDGNCGCMQCQADEQAWDDEDLSEHCDHEDYDADILTGVATCGLCGARWHQTAEEIEREAEAQKHYDEFCADLSQER